MCRSRSLTVTIIWKPGLSVSESSFLVAELLIVTIFLLFLSRWQTGEK